MRDEGPWSASGQSLQWDAGAGSSPGECPRLKGKEQLGITALRPPCHPVMTELLGVAVPRGAEQGPPRGPALQQPLLLQVLPSVTEGLSACRAVCCATGLS